MSESKALTVPGTMDVVVVTPHGEVTHRAATSVTAYGALGELGILPGHIPLLTMLEAGTLVLDGAAGTDVWAHGPGYMEVGSAGELQVLVEQAIAAHEVATDEVEGELEAIEAEIKAFEGGDAASWRNLIARQRWARARLDAHARA